MHFLQFHNLSGGWESFFAQDVKRISQQEIRLPDGTTQWVTQVTFAVGAVMLREGYDAVMEKVIKAWQGEE